MKPNDSGTLAALALCLLPWFAVLAVIKAVCEAMRCP